jgi:hypothetical protein
MRPVDLLLMIGQCNGVENSAPFPGARAANTALKA